MTEYNEKKLIMNKEEISRTIKRLALEIAEKNFGVKDLVIIGLQTRGVYIGKRIIKAMEDASLIEDKEIPFGILDITLYRDDVGTRTMPPMVKETEIPDITDKKVILVDDVIFTGRSIRAAMDELMDFSRPKSIQLAVLVDRGHRELPIEPNFVGKKFTTSKDELIAVELEEIDGKDKVVLLELADGTRAQRSART